MPGSPVWHPKAPPKMKWLVSVWLDKSTENICAQLKTYQPLSVHTCTTNTHHKLWIRKACHIHQFTEIQAELSSYLFAHQLPIHTRRQYLSWFWTDCGPAHTQPAHKQKASAGQERSHIQNWFNEADTLSNEWQCPSAQILTFLSGSSGSTDREG